MIKHMVAWKLDDSYSSEEKRIIVENISSKLRGLKAVIAELKEISVYTNSPEASITNYDVLLDSSFKSFTDLNAYQIHPEHIKVGSYLKSLRLQRAAIDYEI